MDKNDKSRPELREVAPVPDEAIVPALIGMVGGVSERAAALGFGLARDAQGEVKQIVNLSFDLTEALWQGALRTTRGIADRLDALSAEALGRGERVVFSFLRLLRLSGSGAAELAAQSAQGIAGGRTPAPPMMPPRSTPPAIA